MRSVGSQWLAFSVFLSWSTPGGNSLVYFNTTFNHFALKSVKSRIMKHVMELFDTESLVRDHSNKSNMY